MENNIINEHVLVKDRITEKKARVVFITNEALARSDYNADVFLSKLLITVILLKKKLFSGC